MVKTLARHWVWVSRAVILASILPLAAVSVWLGVSVWRTAVTYHVQQTLTIANEGADSQTLHLVAWVVPPTTAAQQVEVLPTSSPMMPAPGEDMVLTVVQDQMTISPGEPVSYRFDLDITVRDGATEPASGLPDLSYTFPGPFLESTDPRIVERAREIVGDETDPAVKARLIYDYVLANVRNQDLGMSPPGEYEANQMGTPGAQSGALWTLEHGYGVCGNFAALYTALCRSAGVPARIVGGWVSALPVPYLTQEGDWGPPMGSHAWVEVYLSDQGWLPVDPFWGQGLAPVRDKYFLDLDNMHIALGDESRLRPAFHNLVTQAQANGFVAAMSGPYWYIVAGPPDARLAVTPHMSVRVEGLPTVWRPLAVFLVTLVTWSVAVDVALRIWSQRVTP